MPFFRVIIMTLFERVIKYIEENNMTMYKFEKLAGINRGNLRNWKTSAPSYENIKKAASFMGVTPEWLMTGEGEETPTDADTAEVLRLLRQASGAKKRAAIAAAIAVLKTNDD